MTTPGISGGSLKLNRAQRTAANVNAAEGIARISPNRTYIHSSSASGPVPATSMTTMMMMAAAETMRWPSASARSTWTTRRVGTSPSTVR